MAYKFIVASGLPQVSYLTSLDIYVLVCFLFILLVVVENVVWPFATFYNDKEDPFQELYVVIVYLVLFSSFNLGYVVRVYWKLSARRCSRGIRRAEFTILRARHEATTHHVHSYSVGNMDVSASRVKLLALRKQRLQLREDIETRKDALARKEQTQKEIKNLQTLAGRSLDKDIAVLLAKREQEVKELRLQLQTVEDVLVHH